MIKVTNQTYDRLKFIALVVLPALGTLYFTLAGLWHLPAAEQVVGTITAIDTFLGVVLHISSKTHVAESSGTIQVAQDPASGKKTYSLVLGTAPENLEQMENVTFKVDKPK